VSGKQKFEREKIIDALRASKGMVYLAAKRLRCTPMTVYNYIQRYASVYEVKEAERGKMVDIAESKLYKAIINGEPWAIRFYLSTKGKDRGYTKRQELSLPEPVRMQRQYGDADIDHIGAILRTLEEIGAIPSPKAGGNGIAGGPETV
jgi:hypothetical protein